MLKKLTLCAVLLLWPAVAFSQTPAEVPPLQRAQRLQREGKTTEAFALYLTIPGAEHIAVALARPKPAQFLTILRETARNIPAPRDQLIEGDLLLALGRKSEALQRYHGVAARLGQNRLENDPAYPVEPPARPENDETPWNSYRHQVVLPFTIGPGSHRDNWLIRRFIALDAWTDAAGEFARIWNIHRKNTQPYVTAVPVYDRDKTGLQKTVVKPAGFNGRGLQFAIDYAYFLKRQKQPAKAWSTLLEPLLVMDMDKNPNRMHTEPLAEGKAAPYPERRWAPSPFPYRGTSAGMSRKEFIRLAFGEFKTAGQETALAAALHTQIGKGQNRARRVLARMCVLQGQPDTALALELEYIKAAEFNSLTATYRRGLIFEDYGKVAEAVAEYEKSLTLPVVVAHLPDVEEEVVESGMRAARIMAHDPYAPMSQTGLEMDALIRLQRLYAALGQTEKGLDITLRQLEISDLSNLALLEQARARFKAAGQEVRFLTWAKEHKAKAKGAQANLAWLLEDYSGVIAALVTDTPPDKERLRYDINPWIERFRKLGKDQLRSLLKAWIEHNPQDSRSRLELLDLEERLEGPAIIAALEVLLNGESVTAFAHSRGPTNRTKFKSYYDLAYRLMRLYEKQGSIDKLMALGLRIARNEKPFAKTDEDRFSFHGSNDVPEHANAALSLAIQYANDAKTREALAAALQDSPWMAARAQLARRGARSLLLPFANKAIGWHNVPPGVRLLASNENVLSLCRDEKQLYVGHPWGVAIYDFKGNPITRVALETAALTMTICNGALWVGTPVGLNRINLADYKVSYLPGDQDVDARDKAGSPELHDFYNGVQAIAARDDVLWIGTRRGVRTLNTKTGALRIFSAEQMNLAAHSGAANFLFDGPYVWVEATGGRRYDTRKDTWQAPQSPVKRYPISLIGIIEGKLWGNVWLNDELRYRPCIINRETLQVTPILIEANDTNSSRDERQINGGFDYIGTYQGKPALMSPGRVYFYDSTTGKLKAVPQTQGGQQEPVDRRLPQDWRGKGAWQQPDGTIVDRENYAIMLTLPDGTKVLGRRRSRTRYEYPREDWPFGTLATEFEAGTGGLHFIATDGKSRRVSATPHADALPTDEVFFALPDADKIWLGTSLGVAVLNGDLKVQRSFNRLDGLVSNRVTSGAMLGGKLYFGTAWGDSGGGLAVFDPQTSVFTSFTTSDGLATDKITAVSAEGDLLKLVYGVEYRRSSDFKYQQYSPAFYNPVTHTFSPAGEPRIMIQEEAEKLAALAPSGAASPWLTITTTNGTRTPSPARAEPMPYLGGYIIARQTINGKVVLCGTRGVVILDDATPAKLVVTEVNAKVTPSLRQQQLAEAGKVAIPGNITVDQLKAFMAQENPYVRANALAAAMKPVQEGNTEYTPVVAQGLTDSLYNVRSTAVWLLSRTKDRAAIKPLQTALKDASPYIRAVAALGLARQGEVPALSYFEEILRNTNDYYGNFPYAARSSIGVEASAEKVYEALAPHANREVFTLFMQHPLASDDTYNPRSKIFAALGASLRQHPEAADILLKAHNSTPYDYTQIHFAQTVFKHSGKALLTVLHKALSSTDRIVRSNAARACGAIGDASSIPHLIKALDLESGLSRASIVWALGELKAPQALPQLANLYGDARNDEARGKGAGYRYAQAVAEETAQYESIRSLDAISGEWNEMKAVLRPSPVDPRRNEELLKPEHILEAVKKIGPSLSQDFYRVLAGEKNPEARWEAAINLSLGNAADRDKNLPILRNLLADSDHRVRMSAAVSLLMHDQEVARPAILEWLNSSVEWQKSMIIKELARVKNKNQLAFARRQLEAVAKDSSLNDNTRTAARRLIDE